MFKFEHAALVLVFRGSLFLGHTVYKFYFYQSFEKPFHADRKSIAKICKAPNFFAVHFFHQQIRLFEGIFIGFIMHL